MTDAPRIPAHWKEPDMSAHPPLESRVQAPDGLLDPAARVPFKQAADLCRVSVDTIRDRRDKGRLPHACQPKEDPHGRWYVPLADLAAAGLLDPARLSASTAAAGQSPAAAGSTASEVECARLRGENEGLRQALEVCQRQIEVLQHVLAGPRAVA